MTLRAKSAFFSLLASTLALTLFGCSTSSAPSAPSSSTSVPSTPTAPPSAPPPAAKPAPIDDTNLHPGLKNVIKTVDGKSDFDLRTVKGKPTLLVFWASWCPPCKREIPDLKVIHQEFGDRINLVSVATSDTPDEANKAVADNQMNWTILLDDENKTVANAFKVSGIPRSFLINANGDIVKEWNGFSEDNLQEFRDALNAQLGAKAL